MARYPISQEGIKSFEQLKKDLQDITRKIEDDGNKLRAVAKGNAEECGYLHEKIEEMLNAIAKLEADNTDKIQRVNKQIDERIQKIETFLKSEL